MMIKKFNGNHAQSQQRLAISAKAAQIQIDRKPNKNVTDNIILSIKEVRKHVNCFEIEWKNGSSLKLYFNGRYEKYNCTGKLSSTGGVGTSRGFMDDGHIVLFINGNGIYFERLIAICEDYVSDEIAIDYAELAANVKDGSGTLFMADKLRVPMNFHPDNIEWATAQENGLHGQMIKWLYEKTGRVYRFSAYDSYLVSIYKGHSIENLKAYCDSFLVEII